MMRPQLSISAAVNAANSAGVEGGSRKPPRASSRAHLGAPRGGHDVGVDLRHDLRRRAGRRVDAGPGGEQVVRHAGLGTGRDAGQRGVALGLRQRQRIHRAAVDQRLGSHHVHRHEGDAAIEQVRETRLVAAIADMHGVEARQHPKELGRHPRRHAAPAEIVPPRLAPQPRDEGVERRRAESLVRHHHEGSVEVAGDGGEVADGVVGQALVERRVGRMGHRRGGKQGQPVRAGARDHLAGEDAVGAPAIVHHHRLAPAPRQALAHGPHGDVHRAPRRERGDDRHPVLGPGSGRAALGPGDARGG